MADYDDKQSDFDDAYAERPVKGSSGAGKRFSRPQRARGGDDPASGATGEVRRPSAGTGRRGGSRAGGGGRGGSRGGGSRSGGAALLANPRARLGLGVLFAVILVLVITLVVRDCQRSQLENSYSEYMNGVAQIVTASADQGQELRTVLSNTEGLQPPQLRERVAAISTQAQGLVDRAEDLNPPGALSEAQASLITLLQYRVSGLSGLANELPTLLAADNDDFAASGIADKMQRFLASDVIYRESFEQPARRAMERDSITGVEVPELAPFLANENHATSAGAKEFLPSLRRTGGGASGDDSANGGEGNLRGNSLVQTEALPSETRLSTDGVTTIEASENLEWRVTVSNQGDFVETDVVVKAIFSYSSAPSAAETREASIPTIEPGQQVTVTLPGPENVDYRAEGNLRIEIAAVPGEAVTDNNNFDYRVKIAL